MNINLERKKDRKQNILIVLGIFVLIGMIGGFTYAFFNYTRTGGANTIQVGRISFVSEQTNANTINLTNAFPISRNAASTDTTNTDDVVITITGDTTYSDGIEYLLTATAVDNTKNNKTVPISIITSASNLGTNDEEYFDNRGGSTAVYKVLAKQTISNNDQLLVGYIPSGVSGVNGSVTIRAFIDRDLVSISDTYDETNGVSDNMGTTSNWVNGRTNFTTTEWNDISVSFKVKVEANEGTWVEEVRSVNAMNTFPTTITDQKANIKEVYFNKMGATAMQNAYNNATIKADLTYNNEGKVLAWLETNTTDNTKYNLIVASDGDTYLTTGQSLFSGWKMQKIEFNNINTERLTSMASMFGGCSNLTSIDLSGLGSDNLTNMGGMFFGCTSLTSINMSNFNFGSSILAGCFAGLSSVQTINLANANTRNITNMGGAFSGCSNLISIDLSGLGGNNLAVVAGMFAGCTSLTNINMSNFNFGTITSLYGSSDSSINQSPFYGLTNVQTIDLNNANISNVTNMSGMFGNSPNLTTIYVSNVWNVSNVTNSIDMFNGCTSLVGTSFNGTTYAFTDYNTTDKTYAVIATNDTVGYLTDISLKPTS